MNLEQINRMKLLLESRTPFALVTVVEAIGSAPQKPGASMIVLEDRTSFGTVGGGKYEYVLQQKALEALKKKQCLLVKVNLGKNLDMKCGGGMTAFIEPFTSGDPVIVFGAGHCGQALAPLLVRTGFDVTVVDDRAEFASPKLFPGDVEVVVSDFVEYASSIPPQKRSITMFVIATRGHEHDFKLLLELLKTEVKYVGVMASRAKAVEFRKKLTEQGLDSTTVDRIAMPIGLPIGSVTPEEIAVSICAQLIQVKRGKYDV